MSRVQHIGMSDGETKERAYRMALTALAWAAASNEKEQRRWSRLIDRAQRTLYEADTTTPATRAADPQQRSAKVTLEAASFVLGQMRKPFG